MRNALLFAREELTDTLRQRKLLLQLVIGPLLLWLLVGLAPVLAQSHSETSDANLHASIGVSRTTPRPLVAALERRLRVVRSRDPEGETEHLHVDAVIEFGGDPARALAEGRPLVMRELQVAQRDKTGLALDVAEGEIREYLAARGGAPLVRQRVTTIAVPDIAEARGVVSRSAPMIYVVLLVGIVHLSASRFQSARSLRTMEAFLVRPLRRSVLLAGMACSAVAFGLLSSIVVLAPFTAVSYALAASAGAGATALLASVGAIVEALVLLCATFAAAGLAVGVSGRTLAATRGRAAIAMFVPVAAGFAIELSGTVAETRWLTWVPLMGPLVLIRQAVTARVALNAALPVGLVGAAVAIACLAYASRYLDSERVTTRA